MISKEKIEAFKKMANSGEIYDSVDEEFLDYQHELVQRINEFNQTPETKVGLKKRDEILQEAMGTYSEGLYIIPPIYANSGLSNVHVGKNVFINFNNNFVDDGEVFIGSDTMIGPNCTFATAVHPISPRLRRQKLQFNKPIHIGENVWLGGNVTVLPGVSIGENSIVGAGSIVTKDIPANVIAVGNPARVLREITEKDDEFYDKDKKVPQEILDKYM
ncbi:sugar O-acetyltransferase [Companilactobacillus sp. HBUAS56275]|uniref:Acetyltransferase n=1 Tax=Candidatus Companilactobacillus pullicola TaxID=2838523 RepID=A0A9D1ZMB9_9LACO|nr:sugar O-acetyltransferase [Candidatus Companilactobacillus pullicola]